MSRIKETAETSEEPPQRITANGLANVSETYGRTIRHQTNHRHQPPNPEMRAEISEHLKYQLSENREQFLLFDSDHGVDDRILTDRSSCPTCC